jgi:hypothetical protein
VGKFVGKNSRVATILSLEIEHRTAVDPVPAAMGEAQQVLLQLRVLGFGLLQDRRGCYCGSPIRRSRSA